MSPARREIRGCELLCCCAHKVIIENSGQWAVGSYQSAVPSCRLPAEVIACSVSSRTRPRAREGSNVSCYRSLQFRMNPKVSRVKRGSLTPLLLHGHRQVPLSPFGAVRDDNRRYRQLTTAHRPPSTPTNFHTYSFSSFVETVSPEPDRR